MRPVTRLLTALACIVGATCISVETIVPTRQLEVGAVVARLSQPDSASVFQSLQMLAVAPDELRLVLNRSSPAAWSISVRDNRTTDFRELRVPPQAQEATRRILEKDRPPPGAELRPITGVHSVHGRTWVTTGGIQAEMLAFSVPRSGSMVPTVVFPGSLRGQERIRDGVVIGDRLLAITETEVLWADLVSYSGAAEADRE